MRVRLLIMSIVLGTIPASAVLAKLPTDQTIQWRFHQSPSNPLSAVDFRIVATLTAAARSGNAVGWEVTSLELFQILPNETKTWVEFYPALDTPDGLWWVTHESPLIPNAAEFLDSPLLEGVAIADDPADSDLAYSLKSTPPMYGPYPQTAGVTYAIYVPYPPEPPIKSGENEIVDLWDTRDAD